MKLKTKPSEKTGQELNDEFEAVVADIRDQADARRDVVRARLTTLEAESYAIADLLNRIGD